MDDYTQLYLKSAASCTFEEFQLKLFHTTPHETSPGPQTCYLLFNMIQHIAYLTEEIEQLKIKSSKTLE